MDGGPFRPQRPAERTTSERSQQPAHRAPKEAVVEHTEKTVPAAPKTHHSTKKAQKSNTISGFLIGAVLVLAICVIGWMFLSSMKQGSGGGAVEIDTSKYQAVFFTNGQVYFGKLKSLNTDYLQLSDVFYIQGQSTTEDSNSSNPQKASDDQSNVQLIKLGEEIHGPEDAMIISQDQVLFYENLKDDSKVVGSINQFKESDK